MHTLQKRTRTRKRRMPERETNHGEKREGTRQVEKDKGAPARGALIEGLLASLHNGQSAASRELDPGAILILVRS